MNKDKNLAVRYISLNSRKDFWGTGALSYISNKLRNDMPGLRGFSESNLKNMRMFYEQWSEIEPNSPATAGALEHLSKTSLKKVKN